MTQQLRSIVTVAAITWMTACAADQAALRVSDKQTLLFLSYRSGNGELYTMDPGDSSAVNLTNNPAFDGFGRWSPDGREIVFDSNRSGSGNRDIYVMDRDGSNVRQLTDDPNFDLLASWSPDGTRLAFMSLRDGEWSPQNTGVEFVAAIYTMNADGTDQRRLTQSRTHEQSPTWSPGGQVIVFSREIDGLGQLFSIGVDGSDERRIRMSNSFDAAPSFSPDGSQIAFYATRGDTSHIWVMDRDGTKARRVTSRFPQNYSPAWSRDGTRICYTVPVDDQWDIYAIDLETETETPLVTDPSRDESCSWGPPPA